jgi:hypothetical protein
LTPLGATDTVWNVIARLYNVLSPPLAVAALCLFAGGCSIEQLAVNKLAAAMADSGDVFAADNDPELVGEALPFALKTYEILLSKAPDNEGLLLATCQGFMQYGYAYVELEAMRLAPVDYRGAKYQRTRVLKLYLRARDYCFQALDVKVPGTSKKLLIDPEGAAAAFGKADVELLVWSAAAWGAAIAAGLNQPELVIDMPSVRSLVKRALELDPDYDSGTLQEAAMLMESLPEALGGSLKRAREHFDRALALHGGHRPSTYVSWAEKVSVQNQNRKEFVDMLERALAIDPDKLKSERLSTLITQKRARLLLEQADDLFFDDLDEE